MARLIPLVLASLVAVALLASCKSSNKSGPPTEPAPTSTPAAAGTATASPAAAGTPAASPGAASEAGSDPVFWRTADNFLSVHAGERYKIVFRITNGLQDNTLVVVADRVAGGQSIEFRANRVTPGGGDAPGSYYPLTITLPQPGRWVLTVRTANEIVQIPIDVGEPGPTAG